MNFGIALLGGILLIFMLGTIYMYLDVWRLLIEIYLEVQDINRKIKIKEKQNYTMKELEDAIKHK